MRWRLSLRINGHTYLLEVVAEGVPDASGMVVDLDRLRAVADGLRDALDHRLLDEVPGLRAPTLECLGEYVLGRYPELSAVRVWRAGGGACEVVREVQA